MLLIRAKQVITSANTPVLKDGAVLVEMGKVLSVDEQPAVVLLARAGTK